MLIQHLAHFSNLKKYWSTLPPTSSSALFPNSGIKKQDDAMKGCDVIASAVLIDRSGDTDAVENQLDPIQKWIVFVLCSKESTVGLQSLVGMIKSLFSFLLDIKHELTDSESLVLLPFLLEKASTAKVSPLLRVS